MMNPIIQITDDLGIGPQPTEQDLEAVAAKGYKTVINLRNPQEETPLPFDREQTLVGELGMEYMNYAVTPDTINDETVEKFFDLLKEKGANGPIFVHCASALRSGMLSLLHLAVSNSWTPQQAFEQAHSMGFDCDSNPKLKAYFADYLARK